MSEEPQKRNENRFDGLQEEIEAKEDEEVSHDEPHFSHIRAQCPKCPSGEGNLEVIDPNVYGVDRVAMDVHCNTCGYNGTAITRLTDFEDKDNGFESAVKNGDVDLIYGQY